MNSWLTANRYSYTPLLSSPLFSSLAHGDRSGDLNKRKRKIRRDVRKIQLRQFGYVPPVTVRVTCRLSRRTLVSEGIGLGSVMLFAAPVLSASLPDMKDPDVLRYYKLENGVRIQDIVDGDGTQAHEGDLVEFNYVCRRSNGYFVHSTVDQFNGESSPVILPLDDKEIIRGLKDVLVGMKVGGKRRALIPPEVGYVTENLKPIPNEFGPRRSLLSHAKEPLIFEVQLVKVL